MKDEFKPEELHDYAPQAQPFYERALALRGELILDIDLDQIRGRNQYRERDPAHVHSTRLV
jgi:hypothetical protein